MMPHDILLWLFNMIASNQSDDCVVYFITLPDQIGRDKERKTVTVSNLSRCENYSRTLDESTALFNILFSGGRHDYWDQAGVDSTLIKNQLESYAWMNALYFWYGIFNKDTLYLSVPCWSCLSSESSIVNCRVMPSIREWRPRYSLYSELKSIL